MASSTRGKPDKLDRTKEIAEREERRLPPCYCHGGDVGTCPRHFNRREDYGRDWQV